MSRKKPKGDEFYLDPEFYDLFSTGVPGDAEYFVKLAADAGRVLELAAGTGRVTIPMAEAGARVTGIDLEPAMLEVASRKLEKLPAKVRQRVTLLEGDMRAFDAGRRFPLIVIPYRAFQHLTKVVDQVACLTCCREHLTKSGRLVIDLFDPNLRILGKNVSSVLGNPIKHLKSIEMPDGGVLSCSTSRTPCPEEQRNLEEWVFEKFDADGVSQWRRRTTFNMRYFFRYEMEHLFELCGLEIVKLEGDFNGGPYRHGGEQLWTVKRA